MATKNSLQNPNEYYDIIIAGKSGQGKSTTGNKILSVEEESGEKIRPFTFHNLLSESLTTTRFHVWDETSDKIKARPQFIDQCKLLANEHSRIRVLDVPAFSVPVEQLECTETKAPSTVEAANLQVIRWMVRVQAVMNLKIRRFVYFLPNRGPLEIAGNSELLDELKLLHHYFGRDVFDNMVVVATHNRKNQEVGMDDSEIMATKQRLCNFIRESIVALNSEVSSEFPCPPVIYIAIDAEGKSILDSITSAKVINDDILPITVQDDICIQCGEKMVLSKAGDENLITGIRGSSGEIIPYEKSLCHPKFCKKYSTLSQIVGGLGHIATFGIPMMFEKFTGQKTWPWFTNFEEICPVCKKPPGFGGCYSVGRSICINGEDGIVVNHTNKLLCT